MENLFGAEISNSIMNSIVYTEEFSFGIDHPFVNNSTPKVVIDKIDSVSAIFKYSNPNMDSGRICVLNFASYKNPGGKFLNGSIAQEECLCRESTLYNVLSSEIFKPYYNSNKNNLNRALYLNREIYTPSIVFKRDNNIVLSDVITCAAPNYSAASRYQKVTRKENFEVLISRVKFILDAMVYNNVDTPIVGAFGCGVFGQHASDVAWVFRRVLQIYKYPFKKVVFAIIPGPNAEEFEKILDKLV
jgi:uncharacterized protein (TIGR02452 family)